MTGAFLPSTDGFAFTNSWPHQAAVMIRTPLGTLGLGDAAGGLCGGMVFAALDYWHAGSRPPGDRPATGTARYASLGWRLLASWNLPAGVLRYLWWMTIPDGDTTVSLLRRRITLERGVAWRTIRQQWPHIRAELDRGVPVALGIVTVRSGVVEDLGNNHQVLAYAYDSTGTLVTVHVYDPNSGPRDDVRISFDSADPMHTTAFTHNIDIKHPVRGFFRTAYRAKIPPA